MYLQSITILVVVCSIAYNVVPAADIVVVVVVLCSSTKKELSIRHANSVAHTSTGYSLIYMLLNGWSFFQSPVYVGAYVCIIY